MSTISATLPVSTSFIPAPTRSVPPNPAGTGAPVATVAILGDDSASPTQAVIQNSIALLRDTPQQVAQLATDGNIQAQALVTERADARRLLAGSVDLTA
jgi:hypothetical protein